MSMEATYEIDEFSQNFPPEEDLDERSDDELARDLEHAIRQEQAALEALAIDNERLESARGLILKLRIELARRARTRSVDQ